MLKLKQKFKFLSKEKLSGVVVLYSVVSVVFVLVTVMNIYASGIISRMGEAYSSMGELSKEYRNEMIKAHENLMEIMQKKTDGSLEDLVHKHLKKAHTHAEALSKIQPKWNLTAYINRYVTAANMAYSSTKSKQAQMLEFCTKEMRNALAAVDASEEERSALIQNEMSFIRFIYAFLLVGNIVAFGTIFFVVFIHDQAFKSKAKKLNESNANFYAIMQGLDSILITIDMKGTIISWNANARRYFELDEQEMIGKNIYTEVPIFQQLKDYFNIVFHTMKRHYKYHEGIHVNKGPRRIINMLCVPIMPHGARKDQIQLLIKIDDVTSFSTENEHQLRERCAMLVSTGMENVVKDSAALNEQSGQMIAALNEYAASRGIGETVNAYTAVLNNSLAQISMVPQKYSSTLQPGQMNKVLIDLNEMVMYVLKVCLKTFPACVNLEVSLNESKSMVLGDPVALSRAFFALMTNAMEAVTEMQREKGEEEGGIIAVSIEKISGERIVCDKIMRFRYAVEEPAYWSILISDTGVGIPKEEQAKIYDPFFTLNKDTGKHKGLGLSVAINAINEQSGFIDVNSSPGKGSVFKLYMPEVADADTMAVSQVSDDLNADDSEIVPGSGTLLFINDDIIMQEITRKLLEKLGYSVLCTDNGFEALDMYIRDKEETGGTIQCLVTNITTGYFKNSDIVRTLKEIDPEANVVAMVGTEFDEDALTLKELGVTAFIRKPYSIPELSKVLAQYIV